MTRDDFGLIAAFLIVVLISLAIGFDTGRNRGYDRALKDVALITPPPKTTDQQCAAWLFNANLKDAKKRICK